MQDQSIAMPFLSRPPRLDGTLAGDVGFDPLGFSNYFDIKWLREAELKHGRVSMLAALGFVVQEKTHLPLPGFDNKLATEAFFSVPAGGLWQIFFTLGFIEVLSNSGKLTPVSSSLTTFVPPIAPPCWISFHSRLEHRASNSFVDLLEYRAPCSPAAAPRVTSASTRSTCLLTSLPSGNADSLQNIHLCHAQNAYCFALLVCSAATSLLSLSIPALL
jgi:hypothetical protein